MHADDSHNRSGSGKRDRWPALGDLPDLPPPHRRRRPRRHDIWLRRIAVCFVLITLALILRSAWAQSGIVSL